MLRRRFTGSVCITLRPATVTLPESGSIMRLMMRIVVVLPQPEGPMSTQTPPPGIVNVSRSTAGCAVPSNRFTRS